MPPISVPITQVWANGISTTNGAYWVTANPAGTNDPQPIDVSLGVSFNSGVQAAWNGFTILMRGNSNTPVFESAINNQLESVLSGYALSSNDTLPPSLQAPSTAPYAFNIQVNFSWGFYGGKQGYQITINNSINSIVYQYSSILSASILATPTLTDSTNYVVLAELENDTMQVNLYPVNTEGFLEAPIFSTPPIKDSSVFPRMSGNVGIDVQTQDTGALVYSMRPFHTVFASFESMPFNSRTPVIGAQLYTNCTPPIQLYQPPFKPLTSSDNMTPTITFDTQRTLSGQSQRINFGASAATQIIQGVQSKPLTPYGDSVSGITDFNALSVSFALWIESSAIQNSKNPFMGFLVNEQGYGIPLLLPQIIPNQWNTGTMDLLLSAEQNPLIMIQNNNELIASPVSAYHTFPSGLYTFVLLYAGGNPTTIWIDNIEIASVAIGWSARAVDNDPFTQNDFPWLSFGNTLNSYANGIRFDKAAPSFQVKAQAFNQAAQIYNGYTVAPRYGQLGRLVFDQTKPSIIPTASSSSGPGIWVTATSIATNTFAFSCEILGESSDIYNVVWSFGDGCYASDQIVTTNTGTASVSRVYEYTPVSPNSGQVYATAEVTDNLGNRGYGSAIVTL